MVNLLQHIEGGELPAEIVVVVSSRSKVLGVERARKRSIPTEIIGRKPFRKDSEFDTAAYSKALVDALEPYRPDLVVMAGFMTKLAEPILQRYDVVNVHPALLPMFGGEGYYGHHVHEAVLNTGVKITGATVHFADAKYDHGPIIAQEAVPVREDDTPDTLADRVQAAERRIYPQAIALYAKGLLKRENGRVRVLS
jgi:formyltetrahydrofolate-dependent phosphoribosylglycinamide formyltransferase